MQGVEILSEKIVRDFDDTAITMSVILVVMLVVVTILCIISHNIGCAIIYGCISVILIMLTVFNFIPSYLTKTTQYEIIVDDSVSLVEFYEKYEIIEQRGKIFVVEEKQK